MSQSEQPRFERFVFRHHKGQGEVIDVTATVHEPKRLDRRGQKMARRALDGYGNSRLVMAGVPRAQCRLGF